MSDNHVIKTWRDPYGQGFYTTRAKKVIFSKGVTILTGCNGSGKTTLLNNIKDELKQEKIPVLFYSDDTDSHGLMDKALFNSDFTFVATSKCSSEGERISLNMTKIIPRIKHFIQHGKDPAVRNIFASLHEDDKSDQKPMSNERWILLDAIDSGYSIDNVLDLKQIFGFMLKDAEKYNVDLYIIVSANAYELVNNENCIDVMSGKNVRYDSYEEYKKAILNTRTKKDKRYPDE